MPRATAKEPERPGFTARFAGFCTHGDWVTPGDLVRYDENDLIEHVECVGAPAPREHGPCPICHLTSCDHEESEKATWRDMGA